MTGTRSLDSSRPEKSLVGRRVVITGAASGIGAATARLFAAEGARLAVLDRNAHAVEEIGRSLSALAIPVDVARETDIDGAVQQAATELGGLDGIVNAAGVSCRVRLEDLALERWQRTLDVNLTGPYLVCRAALPFLAAEPSATIVNVASGLGTRATPGRSAYAASKAGLIAFTRAIAHELGPKIRANVICPGLVDTPMVRAAQPDTAVLSSKTMHYALKRMGTTDEIANAILFLSCPESSFVTSSMLMVDGGQ
jgi:NAD(P)-dependent dehydrogenase (short-subunit alcohol dehydrogenase family)